MDRERVVEEIAGQWEGAVGAGECCRRTAAAAGSAVSQSCVTQNCKPSARIHWVLSIFYRFKGE